MNAYNTTYRKTSNSAQIPDSASGGSDLLQWHKTSHLPDGRPVGRLGAYWYILDEDGSIISEGYREISCDGTGGYTGTRSARTEPVALSITLN